METIGIILLTSFYTAIGTVVFMDELINEAFSDTGKSLGTVFLISVFWPAWLLYKGFKGE